MKKKGKAFKIIYIVYLLLIIAAAVAALLYVRNTLLEYEALRPEVCVTAAMEQLEKDAADADFFTKYGLGEVSPGPFEAHLDVEEEYRKLFSMGEMEFSQKSVSGKEDEQLYRIENGGRTLAEVRLKAVGEPFTKLVVLNSRKWEIEEITPMWEAQDYILTLPVDFYVSANGIELRTEDGAAGEGNQITYTLKGLYKEPAFDIKNHLGEDVSFAVKKGKVLAEFYDYKLMLPATLSVTVDGNTFAGEKQTDGRMLYYIRTLEKPQVCIMDVFGNSISYEAGASLPLTQYTFTVDSRYSLTYAGENIPEAVVTYSENPEYVALKEYVPELPQIATYDIAILEENAEVVVADEQGNVLSYDTEQREHDFVRGRKGADELPAEIADKLDVLKIAQSWSLFMSNDLPFAEVKGYLLKDSYQYEVARKYATGVDIKFTSSHTLRDPAFTGERVGNFKWISDDCFSVDISFVKHMLLRTGKQVDDAMNDRFYFVRYDDTEDGVDNPAWKIVSMKEIVGNE